jgi:hypothetical protein
VRPQQGGGVGSERTPAVGAGAELVRRRPPRQREGVLRGAQQADVGGREDVRSPEVVQQEHLRRPRPDAAHLVELGLRRGVVADGEPVEREAAVEDAFGEVAQGPRLSGLATVDVTAA